MIIIVLYVLSIFTYGLFRKVDCFNSFKKGVKSSYRTLLDILPNMFALVFLIELVNASKILDIAKVFFSYIHIIPELLMQTIFKELSASSSLLVMTDIFNKYGVDSLYGKLSTIIQGSSDTTLYVVSLYFSSVSLLKTRYTLYACMLADVATFIFIFLMYFLLV